MRFIILTTLFLIPLIGLASFPVDNETTEIVNKVSNINLDTKTHWYNTWWAILLNVIIIFIIPQLAILAIPSLLRLLWLIKSKKTRKLILMILKIVFGLFGVFLAWALSDLK